MDKKERAVEFKNSGYNCAQAVLIAFQEETGLSEDVLKRLGAGFAGGMGCMEGTCGALVAAEMVLGLKKYDGSPLIKPARELHQAFAEKCGDTICKDLKGEDTGLVLCSCDDCVRNAVELVENL